MNQKVLNKPKNASLLVFFSMSKLPQRGHIIKHKSASTLAARLVIERYVQW